MKPFWLVALLAISMISPAALALEARDARRLQRDLTPVGAERAGNADGSIPAWRADQLDDTAHARWMQTISDEDVKRVAKTYFTKENRSVATLVESR